MEFLGDGGFTTHVCKTFTVCRCVTAKEEQTEKGREERGSEWRKLWFKKSVLQFSSHHNEGFGLVYLWFQKIKGKHGL